MVRRVGSAACAMSEGKQRPGAGAFRGVCEETGRAACWKVEVSHRCEVIEKWRVGTL